MPSSSGSSYVGYVDRVDDHPWWDGIYDRGRQTYGPVGLGFPLLMEREQYWNCGYGEREGRVPVGSVCDEPTTQSSSPIWAVDRAAWEAIDGMAAATAEAPTDRKGSYEGNATDETALGTLEVGSGRIVVFGAVLPTPSEDHPPLARPRAVHLVQHRPAPAHPGAHVGPCLRGRHPGGPARPGGPDRGSTLPATGGGQGGLSALALLAVAGGLLGAARRPRRGSRPPESSFPRR